MPAAESIRPEVHYPTPTMRELAMVLFRQRRAFVTVSVLVVAAALCYLLAGARYRAHMKVIVRRGRADAPVSAQETAPLDLTRLAITEEDLNSEVELLRDDEVLRKVVVKNGLGGRDWFHFLRMNEGNAERVERQARKLARELEAEPVKKTNLIAVSYASADPRLAAKVLQSVADAYLEKHAVVHRPSGEVRFFEEQTDESRRELEEAKRRLLRFMSGNGVVSAAQERDLTLQKLSDMEGSYRQAAVELAETRQRAAELKGQLATLPQRTTTQVRTADNPELLKALKASLLDLQLKRTELLTKFEPGHPLVQEVEQQIAQARAAITAEDQTPVRDETTDKDTHYEWAASELQRGELQLHALQARAAAILTQESAYQRRARQLREDAIAQEDLLNVEKAAEENYLLYLKKQDEARMADALDERGIVNAGIAEPPVAPALPVWPAWLVLAAGIVAAGTAGTGAAFAADYLDPAFRTPEEVLAYLDAPVLASLPRVSRNRVLA